MDNPDIFNWNDISKQLSFEQETELKKLHRFYHKQFWCYKNAFRYYKNMDLLCNIGLLTELRAYLRGLDYDEEKLINQFKLTDELIID